MDKMIMKIVCFGSLGSLYVATFLIYLGNGFAPIGWGAVRLNPFGLAAPSSHYRFAFEDLDLDGDTDLLALDAYGQQAPFLFFRNEGTPTNPVFSAVPEKNPFGLPALNLLNVIHLRDLDGDKDPDLFAGGMNGVFYFENVGRPGSPVFAQPRINPFGIQIPQGSNTLIPAFGDLNGDGLVDLLIGDYNARLFYYQNEGSENAPNFGVPSSAPFGFKEASDQAIFLAPMLEDFNGDGLLDLLTGFNPGTIVLYINSGTTQMPVYSQVQHNPIGADWDNFPVWAMPFFYDLDGDGDRDIFVSTFSDIHYFEYKRN